MRMTVAFLLSFLLSACNIVLEPVGDPTGDWVLTMTSVEHNMCAMSGDGVETTKLTISGTIGAYSVVEDFIDSGSPWLGIAPSIQVYNNAGGNIIDVTQTWSADFAGEHHDAKKFYRITSDASGAVTALSGWYENDTDYQATCVENFTGDGDFYPQ